MTRLMRSQMQELMRNIENIFKLLIQ